MVFGEITTKAQLDYDTIVRKAVSDIGSAGRGSEQVGERPSALPEALIGEGWHLKRGRESRDASRCVPVSCCRHL